MPKRSRDADDPDIMEMFASQGPDYPPWRGVNYGANMYSEPYVHPAPGADLTDVDLMHRQTGPMISGSGYNHPSLQQADPIRQLSIFHFLQRLFGGSR